MNIVIAYHTNNNGMGTWCIEAANALSQAGHNIVLVRAKDVAPTSNTGVTTLLYGYNKAVGLSIMKKMKWRLKKWFGILLPIAKNTSILPEVLPIIRASNFEPDFILLNIPSQLSLEISIPQLVVGWASPSNLGGYLSKWKKYNTGNPLKVLSEQYNWYRLDNWSYRNASGVLAVSKHLAGQLNRKGINAINVYPGTKMVDPIKKESGTSRSKIVLAMAAYHLEEPRKRISWMIEQIAFMGADSCDLLLIGEYSQQFQRQVLSLFNENVIFTGFLKREEVKQWLSKADIFLFGSVIDDWGFVQVEAMAQGLAVFAPMQSPCDEIIGRDDYLFNTADPLDFGNKLKVLLQKQPALITADKEWFYERYNQFFSDKAFAKGLENAIKTTMQIAL